MVAGAVGDGSKRANVAFWIFGAGILLLCIHTALFVYRVDYVKENKNTKSSPVFWTTLVLSVFAIPIAFLNIMFSAGMSCGFGASLFPSYLIVLELLGLGAQLISWRFPNKPYQSPIPHD